MKRKKIRGSTFEPSREHHIPPKDAFPPFITLSHVRTKKPNMGLREKMSERLWNQRQWGVRGMITGINTGNDAWQEVLLPDGTLTYYHQSELTPWRDDDDDGEYHRDPIVDPSNLEPCLMG